MCSACNCTKRANFAKGYFARGNAKLTIAAQALIEKPTAVVQLVGREHEPHDRIEKKHHQVYTKVIVVNQNKGIYQIHNCRQIGM